MDDLIYTRQADLHLTRNCSVALVGAGGVGTWFAITGVMSGVITKLTIWDDDVLSIANLNRLPYTTDDVGKPKVELLKDYLLRLRPNISITAYNAKLNPDIAPLDSGVIVCATDTADSQALCKKYADDNGRAFIRLACSKDSVTVTNKVSSWDGGNTTDGYEGIAIWAYPVMLTGMLGALSLAKHDGELDIVSPLEKITPPVTTPPPLYITEGATLTTDALQRAVDRLHNNTAPADFFYTTATAHTPDWIDPPAVPLPQTPNDHD